MKRLRTIVAIVFVLLAAPSAEAAAQKKSKPRKPSPPVRVVPPGDAIEQVERMEGSWLESSENRWLYGQMIPDSLSISLSFGEAQLTIDVMFKPILSSDSSDDDFSDSAEEIFFLVFRNQRDCVFHGKSTVQVPLRDDNGKQYSDSYETRTDAEGYKPSDKLLRQLQVALNKLKVSERQKQTIEKALACLSK